MPWLWRSWLLGWVLAALSFGASSESIFAEETPAPGQSLHFENDILPILTRYGCNGGGCHGRATGQNGFRLSLFGFDPAYDYAAVAEEGLGRRVSWTRPEESLLLRKATGESPHGGGVRFEVGSQPYQVLSDWMSAGTPWGAEDAPHLSKIEVDPAERLVEAGSIGALRVTAHYSDGQTRDVTELVELLNQTPGQLSITPERQIQVLDAPGQGLIAVRYMGLVAISRWTVPYRADASAAENSDFAPVNYIDQHVLAQWKKMGLAPSPPAGDAEFHRRVFLDLIGTLPTPQETREFLADQTPDKRQRLIDRLFQRPEYASYWALKWGDILRNRQGDAAQKENSVKFSAWIKEQMAANTPYDQFARSLLTVTGKLEDHPQMDWYRQLNIPQNRVEDTCQVFLGMRVSCANCHNHPFERISQDDYWRFAAFFTRIDSISYGTVKTITLKDEGATQNPRTGQEVKPRAFGGPEVEYVKGEDTRGKLVEWLTAKDNPYFARTLVNRLWGHFLKRGLVEAVDDHRATNPPSNPALLDALAQDFAEHGYDMQRMMRLILQSRVYGLSSQPRPENLLDKQNYARHYPQRMPPHVLLDAIDFATGGQTKFAQFPEVTRAVNLPTELEQNDFLDIFGRTKRDTPCTCETRLEPNLSQVLYLLFSPELQQAISRPEGFVAQACQGDRPTVELVEEIYLRTLSRLPTDAERTDAVALIDAATPRQPAAEDLLWTLLNSKEFSYNH